MPYTIDSGKIQPGVLYLVLGSSATVNYNAITYSPGATFRGVNGINSFTVTNGATVTEVTEVAGSNAEYALNMLDAPVFAESTLLTGMAVEYELTPAEKIVSGITQLQGFGIEFIDNPIYSFEITETRL